LSGFLSERSPKATAYPETMRAVNERGFRYVDAQIGATAKWSQVLVRLP
jgi:hypothetical protein